MKMHTHCGVSRTKGRETKACGEQLFSDRERKTGICRSCSSGWSVKANHFASEAEKERATVKLPETFWKGGSYHG